MTASPPAPRRGPVERLAAWLATGPLGHLWSVVADVSAFALRSFATRLRRRLRDGGG
jgi:hypothetical protein